MSGCARMASTICRSPLTTFSTPAGSPASLSNSANRSGTEGSRSDGFKMKALPAAIAGANIHIGIIAGKLNGVIPAPIPKGWRSEYMSIAGPTPYENSPFIRCGKPIANSTTSSPRRMSPLESSSVLPCSRERRSAKSSRLRLI